LGWADCTVRTDGKDYDISASYLSDALGKLVLAAAAVLAGAHSISVGFDEEPGEYRWAVVHTDNGTVRLTVLSFQELWGNRPDADGTPLCSWTGHPVDFGRAVRDAAEAVLKKHGLSGYKERWAKHDFPSPQLELLKSYIAAWEGNR
jgi:hypothetical protein